MSKLFAVSLFFALPLGALAGSHTGAANTSATNSSGNTSGNASTASPTPAPTPAPTSAPAPEAGGGMAAIMQLAGQCMTQCPWLLANSAMVLGIVESTAVADHMAGKPLKAGDVAMFKQFCGDCLAFNQTGCGIAECTCKTKTCYDLSISPIIRGQLEGICGLPDVGLVVKPMMDQMFADYDTKDCAKYEPAPTTPAPTTTVAAPTAGGTEANAGSRMGPTLAFAVVTVGGAILSRH